jgi:Zn-dependent M28 family amino/carboxypeptidase
MYKYAALALILLLAACSQSTPQPAGYAGSYTGTLSSSGQTINATMTIQVYDEAQDIFTGSLTSQKTGYTLSLTCSPESGKFSCYRFTTGMSFMMSGNHDGRTWSGTMSDNTQSGTFSLSK